MTTTQKKQSQIRKRHSQHYKTEALALADRVGVATAAKQLDFMDTLPHQGLVIVLQVGPQNIDGNINPVKPIIKYPAMQEGPP